MDKIAQKLNAQEIIRANSSAEANEMKRMRAQVVDYENILSNIRNTQDRYYEILRAMNELVTRAKGMVDSAGEGGRVSTWSASSQEMSSHEMLRQKELLEDISRRLLNVEKIEEQGVRINEISRKIEDIAINVTNGSGVDIASQIEEIVAKQERLLEAIYQQDTSVIANNQTENANNILGKLDVLGEQQRVLPEFISDSFAKLSEEQFGVSQSSLTKLVDLERQAAAITIVVEKLNNLEKQAELTGKILEKLEELKGDGEGFAELENKLKEYVHQESVKVYRNVQAVVTEGFDQHAKTTVAREKKIIGNVRGIKAISIIVLLISLLNLLASCFGIRHEIMEMFFR